MKTAEQYDLEQVEEQKALQQALDAQNAVIAQREILEKEIADLELEIMGLEFDVKKKKTALKGIMTAIRMSDNNISKHKSQIKQLEILKWHAVQNSKL